MKIAIGCDHTVVDQKKKVVEFLVAEGHEVIDCGTYDKTRTHYPIYGIAVGLLVSEGKAEKGIVICGTGIGISNAVNKIKNIRCSLARDYYTVVRSRQVLDSNVVAFGGRVVGIGFILQGVKKFLETPCTFPKQKLIDAVNNLNPKTIDLNALLLLVKKWENGDYTNGEKQAKIPLPKEIW